jgi:hypothetical protein
LNKGGLEVGEIFPPGEEFFTRPRDACSGWLPGQLTVRAAWSTTKSSRSQPPGHGTLERHRLDRLVVAGLRRRS